MIDEHTATSAGYSVGDEIGMAAVQMERTQRMALPSRWKVRIESDKNIGETQMLHIVRLKRRSALVNEFILRPWLIETTIPGGAHPRCDVWVSVGINMPKGKISAKY